MTTHGDNPLATLPATTQVLPHVTADTRNQLAILSPAQLAALDRGEARWGPAEGERWATWGAARAGAREVLSRAQSRLLLGLALAGALLFALWPHALLVWALFAVTVIYLVAGAYKCWLMLRGARAAAVAASRREGAVTAALPDAALPIYTVLVPLHHEGAMLPVLIERLAALDYPADLLEVLLLLEADDDETRVALDACALPPQMRPITVPPGLPRTKPRALNVGLARARGEFVVVYDAEDQPAPDQLRQAVAAFRAAPPEVVCYQARLSFYNPRQSLLTRLFTLDYYVWYDLVLPGLARLGAFVPLGGTSNHFRTMALRRLGGWDPFNVTEDGELGVRIARAGLAVAMLDSITWEEAVARLGPWVRQRSRWIKGYMQTYLVHMRDPRALWREIGPLGFCDFQVLLGGASLALLVNPLMWLLTLLYIAGHGTPLDSAIQSLFPPAVYYPALICLVAGNFVFLYTNIYACVRGSYYDLTRYMLLGPLYWVLMSVAAWVALAGLVRHPHYWAKTPHGVSLGQVLSGLASAPAGNGLAARAVAPARRQTSAITGARAAAPASPQQRGSSGASGDLALTIVLPAYNEEAVIADTVRACLLALDRLVTRAEVVVVDDGSRDQTGAILDELATQDSRVVPIHCRHNQGYGAALTTGFRAARGRLLFFMDSDGQFDVAEIGTLWRIETAHPGAVVIGYRALRCDATVRVLNAWAWKQLVRAVLGLRGIRDINCAFKLLPTALVRRCDLVAQGAAINTELLAKLQRMGVPIWQVAVQHYPRTKGRATGANLRVIVRAFRELALLRGRPRGWQAAPAMLPADDPLADAQTMVLPVV